MPRCSECGKKGLFLKLDNYFRCEECARKEKERAERERKAYDLIDEANNLIHRIGKISEPKDLESYFSGYNKVLSLLQEAATIQKDTVFAHQITEDVQKIHDKFLQEKQWHIRDVIESIYNEIINNAKGAYKNYPSETRRWCRETMDILHQNKNEFDSETSAYVDDILSKLAFKFYIRLPYSKETAQQTYDVQTMDGLEFESWCANLLRGNGFIAVDVTKGSGDQGVDIIAEKDDIRYAIQCKRYASNLGNTPVQEVCAGKFLYKCHVGVVMTNSYFTDPAKELAQATGVILWDGDKLAKMQAKYLTNTQEKQSK